MDVSLTQHAHTRMKQRGVTKLEVMHVLKHPLYIKKIHEGRKEAVSIINNREIKVIFVDGKNYIKVITVM